MSGMTALSGSGGRRNCCRPEELRAVRVGENGANFGEQRAYLKVSRDLLHELTIVLQELLVRDDIGLETLGGALSIGAPCCGHARLLWVGGASRSQIARPINVPRPRKMGKTGQNENIALVAPYAVLFYAPQSVEWLLSCQAFGGGKRLARVRSDSNVCGFVRSLNLLSPDKYSTWVPILPK